MLGSFHCEYGDYEVDDDDVNDDDVNLARCLSVVS
jgi:hypothetical protein